MGSKYWERKKERKRAKWAREAAANSGKKVHKPDTESRRERSVKTICAVRKPRKKKIGLGDSNFRPMVSPALIDG